jgi:methylthioribose-1-phosphate isomerase
MYTPGIKFVRNELLIVDQTLLPARLKYIQLQSIKQTCDAINSLKVRGAPALGIVAAYSLYIASKKLQTKKVSAFTQQMNSYAVRLIETRPTAVNLHYAVERIQKIYHNQTAKSVSRLKRLIRLESIKIHQEDQSACYKIGQQGLKVVTNPCNILTHCNTGSLATGGWGTALGVIYAAVERGYHIHVYVTETRPLGQGARLTYWELNHHKIPCTLIVDNCVGFLMQSKKIDLVLFGADRIARNGDVANKIGSYSIAALAKLHKIPCYTVAPSSTFDPGIQTGKNIPIEERTRKEILQFYNYNNKLCGFYNIFNPAFDITPARFLSGIISDKGIFRKPIATQIKQMFK